ncbi:hypothetical protein [Frondihabitans cladoniiphilus]|uniref:DUF418 domain-containing protein n=1 Tax=Frondihabitans cladoniiphilus TaxID=715785 RepID=A0ABP8W9J0_9MICO
MELLSTSLSAVLFALILAETGVSLRARQAVKGSRERYVALTQRRILSWAVTIGFVVQGVLGLATGSTWGGFNLLFALYLAYVEIKNHKDDDDWFKGRGKKIWKGVKSGLAKLRPKPIHLPSPVPSPVFG